MRHRSRSGRARDPGVHRRRTDAAAASRVQSVGARAGVLLLPLARLGPVDAPVAADCREPAHAVRCLARREHEAADHALPALEVAVEDVHTHALWRFDGAAGLAIAVAPRVAERALPEADVARSDVEIAGEGDELLERRRGAVRTAFLLELGIEAPAVEDGDPGADVADGDHEVVGVVRRIRDSPTAGHEG